MFDEGAEDNVTAVAPKRLGVDAEVAVAVVVIVARAAETVGPADAAVFGVALTVVAAVSEVFPMPAKRLGVGPEAADVGAGAEGDPLGERRAVPVLVPPLGGGEARRLV